jgi:dTDP-4-dehydrorhamnose reductase
MADKILILGNGYIANRCKEAWPDAVLCPDKITTTADVEAILDKYKPTAVLNAAGVVGKPNVDWCETHQQETIFGNTILPILIAEACQKKNIYLLHIGTGCIFYGYKNNDKTGPGWTEEDLPNPSAVYTRAKYAADLVLSTLPNVGIGRIRMPLDDRPIRANLVDKLASFPKVIDVINSITVVPDMINAFRQLLEKKGSGVFHVTNPGAIRHREIMTLYEELVDPSHTNEWIAEEDLLKQGLVKRTRSNNILSSQNLEKLGIHMPEVHEAVRAALQSYAKAKQTA